MAAQKKAKGLGRGLDALFGDAEVTPAVTESAPRKKKTNKSNNDDKADDIKTPAEGGVIYVDINDLLPNASQTRKRFD